MSPIAKSASTEAWKRKPSNAPDFRYGSIMNSDGNSSSYSSGEENVRLDRKQIPSFMLNDDLNGRSYVDPWDMENYSFLRRQLEDVSLSDNELSSTPAFESVQSDFYYVPLDNDGSPQYQYKHYLDFGASREGIAISHVHRRNSHGLVANVDESDFYNEHLDTPHQSLQSGSADSYPELSNPSRQSERSRYNNQDYQTYMPPSIVKDIRGAFEDTHFECRNRKSPQRCFSDLNLDRLVLGEQRDFSPDYVEHTPRRRRNVEFELKENKGKPASVFKVNLSRRKSFHELSTDFDAEFEAQERRKSAIDHPQTKDRRPVYNIGVPDYRPKEGIARRKSIHEIASDVTRKGKNFISQRMPRKSVLNSSENLAKGSGKDKGHGERKNLPRPHLSPVPESSLVYVYETAKRRRKMVLPNIGTGQNRSPPQGRRFSRSAYEDGFGTDPMENCDNSPASRYTMTNYGHLKIDYSCSWNCLDKYIAHRIRT